MPGDPLALPLVLNPHARLLEVFEVAYKLKASPEHVRRLIRDGKLTAIRLGTRLRVDPMDLHAFIEAQRVPATTKATAILLQHPRGA